MDIAKVWIIRKFNISINLLNSYLQTLLNWLQMMDPSKLSQLIKLLLRLVADQLILIFLEPNNTQLHPMIFSGYLKVQVEHLSLVLHILPWKLQDFCMDLESRLSSWYVRSFWEDLISKWLIKLEIIWNKVELDLSKIQFQLK